MDERPRLLDAFCGAGGATRGYQLAGFHVTGVDNRPQPRYCGEAFVQADALEYIAEHGAEYGAIHASPPCQLFSDATPARTRSKHVDLVTPLRPLLEATGRPWVIENVRRAPLRGVLMLCGSMFGLEVRRHRYFEPSGAWLTPFGPATCDHRRPAVTVTGNGAHQWTIRKLGGYPGISRARSAMGIDWTNRAELSQAIPPAYTEWIGAHLRAALRPAAA